MFLAISHGQLDEYGGHLVTRARSLPEVEWRSRTVNPKRLTIRAEWLSRVNPSLATQAPVSVAISPDNSMEATPIAIPHSSRSYEPKLAAGDRPAASSNGRVPAQLPEAEASYAQETLQEWKEVKDEEGTIARIYTHIAQKWPLEDGSKLDDVEAAILTLRHACNLWHQGTHLMEEATESKADGRQIHDVTGTMSAVIDQNR